jgi:hypothetical protein
MLSNHPVTTTGIWPLSLHELWTVIDPDMDAMSDWKMPASDLK